MENLTEFPHEVITELKYYVYRLIDPRNGETFYVGKGNGNRVFQHVKRALIDSDHYSLKYERIRDIDRAGLEVLHIIHRHGMDEDTAIHVEAALIDAFPGLSNLQNGTGNNEYGQMHAQEIIHKYGLPEAHFQHRIMMISVNWTLGERPEAPPTRIGFNGTEAPQHIKQLYLNTRIPTLYRKKGAANPVKYTY